MDPIFIISAVVIITFILIILFNKGTRYKYTYISRKYLLTKAELNFYNQLKRSLPSQYSIMCKVRIADIVDPQEYGKTKMYAFNKIKSKHVDFLLINSETSEIITIVELNDSSHLLSNRIARDNFIEEVFKNAKLNFKVIRVKNSYHEDELNALIS